MFAIRVAALGLIVCVFVIAGVLAAVGAPIPLAIFIAFLLVGLAAMLVERRLGRDAPVLGITFLSIGGLVGIAAMVQAVPQVNGWIIGLGTLAVEIGILIGLVKLYRVLAAGATVALRRRLAERRGWRYVPQAEVPVPGPRSAPRLQGVPNDARSTTGRDVVYATANGFNVTVFDRVRPNEKNARPQTVCLVHLPMAMPYLSSSFGSVLDAPNVPPNNPVLNQFMPDPAQLTDNESFARTLMTPQFRTEARRLPSEFWIENAYLCMVLSAGARSGAKASEVEQSIDATTSLAARLPWQAIAPFGVRV
jgi:hypothetical protein